MRVYECHREPVVNENGDVGGLERCASKQYASIRCDVSVEGFGDGCIFIMMKPVQVVHEHHFSVQAAFQGVEKSVVVSVHALRGALNASVILFLQVRRAASFGIMAVSAEEVEMVGANWYGDKHVEYTLEVFKQSAIVVLSD